MKILTTMLICLFAASVLAAPKANSSKKYSLSTDKSRIEWFGEKQSISDDGDKHQGLVDLKSGEIQVQSGKITAGRIVVNMNSITNTDVKNATWNKKLVDHLKSEDFFAVNSKGNDTATFEIRSVTPIKGTRHTIKGDLTIRSKTKKGAQFEATIVKKGDNYITDGDLVVNRTEFGVMFNSEASVLKKLISIPLDKIIKDKFILSFHLEAHPAAASIAAQKSAL